MIEECMISRRLHNIFMKSYLIKDEFQVKELGSNSSHAKCLTWIVFLLLMVSLLCLMMMGAMQSNYIMVTFLWNTHTILPIAHLGVQGALMQKCCHADEIYAFCCPCGGSYQNDNDNFKYISFKESFLIDIKILLEFVSHQWDA